MWQTIQASLVERFGPMGPLYLVGALGLLLIAIALPAFLVKKRDPFDRLKALQEEARPAKKDRVQELRLAEGADKLQRFAHFLEPKSAEELSATKLQLLRAGYSAKNAVRMFHFSKMAFGIGALIIGLVYTLAKSANTGVEADLQSMMLSTLLPAAIGYYAPIRWVNMRVQKRQEQIVAGFPDALDLLLVCVEAGQSLDQSINRVASEMRAGYPALAEEFETVAHEVKAGKERVTVLKDMAERVGITDVSSFVTTLVQSATFGTSIAESLRVYSAEMRDKRVMRAEEKANVLPTKLTLGTMLFTVPPLMIIMIGPSVYGVAQTLSKMNGF